jgi:RimJ/RimL family protein N-acetyltransferase
LIRNSTNLLKDFLKLTEITNSDHKFLYSLLKERGDSVNISHKKMPSYLEHVKFVLSKPYSKWYIVKLHNKKIGSAYLSKQNEIGIFLKKEFQGKNIGQVVLKKFIEENPRKRFLANINPKNKKSINFFKKNNFVLIQFTYEYIPQKGDL